MMQIIPAIDLRGGNVVRLFKGEYEQETVYSDNPSDIAVNWEIGGAKLIHLVDLEGARDGIVKNAEAIKSIVQNTSVKTELGGGLRDLETVAYVIETLGVSRAILGSVLLEKPELATQAALRYPNQIVLGIDARDGLVATRGWRETSTVRAVDLVKEFAALPIAAVIYTDIARDGTLEGPNLEATAEMAGVSPFPIIASGGIGSLDDIKAVVQCAKALSMGEITGVIVGKALYEKKFTVEQAIAASNG
jgi:phosphoribosylformimino-5-aminoimidazole carboxamide ribotide isomerase